MVEQVLRPIRFKGHKNIVQRIVIATLTGTPIHISHIRPSSSTNPGLAAHEISFLRLIESVTNGSHIEISYTGTTLLYKPGLITGSAPGSGASGGVLRHEVSAECTRGVSFFLTPLCLLAPFSKAPIDVLFTGPGVITSATSKGDISVDSVRTAILPLYAHFGISNNLELRILARSNPGPGNRGGAGEVHLIFGHQVRLPKTIHLLNPGRIKKIRGVAYATGVSGSNNARMIDEVRGILNPLNADTYIYSDVSAASFVSGSSTSHAKDKSHRQKIGIGFGLSLVAESSTGMLYSADAGSSSSTSDSLGTESQQYSNTPEEIGRQCAHLLLDSILHGGCVSTISVPTVLTMMAMGSEDVARVQLGRHVLGSETVIDLARDLKALGCNVWGIRNAEADSNLDPDQSNLIVSIVGKGIGNVGRKVA